MNVSLFFSPAYVIADYEFDSTRKPAWIAESLSADPLDCIEPVEPEPISFEQICEIHDAAYVQAVRSGSPKELAESNCFRWDPGVWEMVTAQNGGAVAAAKQAMLDGVSGSLSTGLHHAYRATGKGFCTFNGLALAAAAVLNAGARQVLIIDLDAHCGGGTHSLICDDQRIWQIDVSTSNFDEHRDTERSQVNIIKTPSRYLSFIRERLDSVSDISFDLCLYFSGMDVHEGCAFGGAAGFDDALIAERERLVFSWCATHGIPISFYVGGGYTGKKMSQTHLVKLHRETLLAATRYHQKPSADFASASEGQ